MERTPLPIAFPLGGLDLSLSFQTQPQLTSSSLLNVLPQEGTSQRARGGVRPGLSKYSTSNFGGPFRTMTVYTNWDGTRSLIGICGNQIAVASITGEGGGSGFSDFSPLRPQCVSLGDRVYFAGGDPSTLVAIPYAVYSGPGLAGTSAANAEEDPSVAFPYSAVRGICVKYNRMWVNYSGDLSGIRGRPSRVWASKVGDYLKFNDAAGLANTDASSFELNLTKDQVTAMIPWFDNYMVFATATSTYVLNGDPRKGGISRPVSTTRGIVDAASWVIGESNTIYAMSAAGPITLSQDNPFGEPQLLMSDRLPGVLSAPNTVTTDHVFGYDSRSKRIHIFCPKKVAEAGTTHWTYDLRTKAWFPLQFGTSDHEPFCCIQLREIPSSRSDMLMCCRDGYLRYFDETAVTDDGTNIVSHAFMGPYRVAQDRFTKVREITGTLAGTSGRATVSVHTGDTPQDALESTADWSNIWLAGRSRSDRPSSRGGSVYVQLAGVPGEAWAFEEAVAQVSPGGKLRV